MNALQQLSSLSQISTLSSTSTCTRHIQLPTYLLAFFLFQKLLSFTNTILSNNNSHNNYFPKQQFTFTIFTQIFSFLVSKFITTNCHQLNNQFIRSIAEIGSFLLCNKYIFILKNMNKFVLAEINLRFVQPKQIQGNIMYILLCNKYIHIKKYEDICYIIKLAQNLTKFIMLSYQVSSFISINIYYQLNNL
eukprot:TRINITY_DN9525_c0_g2_i1.p1 TRINITY_DN9525_c0_g2~~TRINITY_DN9525_c0_g2_i1.p1  ORF type:complete len:191 (+),score=-15.51 TRINITY_DN9525_c0_g2_i1:61-633(+)